MSAQDRDYEVKTMQEQEMVDASSTTTPVSSGFTAINRQPRQLLKIQSAAPAPAQQNQARRRRRTIAQYLGLETLDESVGLVGNFLLPQTQASSPAKSSWKRQKQVGKEHASKDKKATTDNRKDPKQRYVSEGAQVTKTIGKSSTPSSKTSVTKTPQPQSAFVESSRSVCPEDHLPENIQDGASHYSSHNVAVKRSRVNLDNFSENTIPSSPTQNTVDTVLFDVHTNQYDAENVAHFDFNSPHCRNDCLSDEDFNDDLDDEDFIKLSSGILDSSSSASHMYSSPTKTEQLHDYEPGSSADVPVVFDTRPGSPRRTRFKFVSPIKLTTRLLATKDVAESTESRKPIVRSPFPAPVRDRSPIIGLSSNMVLKTCFRIGEAINQSHQAPKAGKHVMIELYARILSSERDEKRQDFVFRDLFHAKPPYIKAVYDAAIWKQVQLFNYDSQRLLQEGRICRCMGKMKRDGKEWIMTVWNIWEATWEDVEWVEGIINS